MMFKLYQRYESGQISVAQIISKYQISNGMNSLRVMCCQQREAVRMCMSEACNKDSLICSYEECSCSRKHINCMGTALVSTLTSNLYKKLNSFQPATSHILEFYSSLIKFLVREKEEFLSKDIRELILTPEENRLLESLEKGDNAMIMPPMVSSVVKSLTLKPLLDTKKLMDALLEETERINKAIGNGLTQIKQFCSKNTQKLEEKRVVTELKQVQISNANLGLKELLFDPDNIHPNFLLSNNLLNLKLAKMSSEYVISLVSPSIESRVKICLRIIKKSNFFYVGMCSSESAKQSKFQTKKDTRAYMISSEGQTQHKKSGSFKFATKDLIQITADPSSSTLHFLNKGKKQEGTLRFKKEQGESMHFCICMFGVNSEVEIVPEARK